MFDLVSFLSVSVSLSRSRARGKIRAHQSIGATDTVAVESSEIKTKFRLNLGLNLQGIF